MRILLSIFVCVSSLSASQQWNDISCTLNEIDASHRLLEYVRTTMSQDVHLSKEVIEKYQENGADINAFFSETNCLFTVVRKLMNSHPDIIDPKDLPEINDLKILITCGTNINACNPDGKTALHKSLEPKILIIHDQRHSGTNYATSKALIDLGANPNIQDVHGNTVLHEMFNYPYPIHNYLDLCKLFLTHNANLEQQNSNGETPYMCAARCLSKKEHYNFLETIRPQKKRRV